MNREIKKTETQLLCCRPEGSIEFREILHHPHDAAGFANCIRIYGGSACAVLQLRAVSALTDTPGAKKRILLATAAYLDKNEVAAMIERLQQILPTLRD